MSYMQNGTFVAGPNFNLGFDYATGMTRSAYNAALQGGGFSGGGSGLRAPTTYLPPTAQESMSENLASISTNLPGFRSVVGNLNQQVKERIFGDLPSLQQSLALASQQTLRMLQGEIPLADQAQRQIASQAANFAGGLQFGGAGVGRRARDYGMMVQDVMNRGFARLPQEVAMGQALNPFSGEQFLPTFAQTYGAAAARAEARSQQSLNETDIYNQGVLMRQAQRNMSQFRNSLGRNMFSRGGSGSGGRFFSGSYGFGGGGGSSNWVPETYTVNRPAPMVPVTPGNWLETYASPVNPMSTATNLGAQMFNAGYNAFV